ncbi:riboflavin synthase subunit alpha [Pantoea sp. Mhis]|uniref:riboflavin synthase subunit alpha n=1 Tax=Pantoea sp. Mhis TaxID=2576759 RepID=UPI00135C5471|nr:riboflavin synthase subunit alpha [Pantoea sp. Mhis]MXP56207.1 riboflavin synthase subunit alpha [Pantoea sp. Mhis]
MFTGIIQGIAKVIDIKKIDTCYIYVMHFPNVLLTGLNLGASVANNGCCLTVTNIEKNYVSFMLIKETLNLTNLGELKIGDMVNIERAAKLSDEIGGHLMSGHIVTTATISKIKNSINNKEVWFELLDKKQMKYILHKGFIGIDGISLTVSNIYNKGLCVNLIPETLKRTSLGMKTIADKVNIEIDSYTQAIIKTVESFLSQTNISMLTKNTFN